MAAADVLGRDALTRSLAGDPISLGIIGALALGALAALAFASIGFIVSATVTTSERITEFAILRALGLSARELSAWMSLENAFLLVFGLVAGIGARPRPRLARPAVRDADRERRRGRARARRSSSRGCRSRRSTSPRSSCSS